MCVPFFKSSAKSPLFNTHYIYILVLTKDLPFVLACFKQSKLRLTKAEVQNFCPISEFLTLFPKYTELYLRRMRMLENKPSPSKTELSRCTVGVLLYMN